MTYIKPFSLEVDKNGEPTNPIASYIFDTVATVKTIPIEHLQYFLISSGIDLDNIEISNDLLDKSSLEVIKPYFLFSTILYKLLYTTELEKLLKKDKTLVPSFQERVELNIVTLVTPLIDTIAKERQAKEEAEAKLKEVKQQSKYLPTVHGKATDSLASMVGKPVTIGFTGISGTVDSGEVTLVLDKINELRGLLGTSTHKLLSVAIAEFTKSNHVAGNDRRLDRATVYIKLEDYAALCGYGVYAQETFTEEAALKERKRAESSLKNARNKISKDLALLFSASLSWSEKVGKDKHDFRDVRLIEAKGIKKGTIEIRFSQTFSEYLVRLPTTQYPTPLLRVDERNSNAYAMGLKISTHYNMDSNVTQATNNRLRVTTLLQVTDLPTFDKVSNGRKSWEERIKEPFEESLEKLVQCGFLSDWRYCHPKGVEMTDEEATHFPDCQIWENTLIKFEVLDPPDHEERRTNKQKKITESKNTSKPKKRK